MRSVALTLPTSVGRDGADPLVLGTTQEMQDALSEEPLNLIAEVVRQDLPFSEIVTADWTVLDAVGAQVWYGHDYDANLGGLQIAHLQDGAPAGILSTSAFLRHESNGANYNRARQHRQRGAAVQLLLRARHPHRGRPVRPRRGRRRGGPRPGLRGLPSERRSRCRDLHPLPPAGAAQPDRLGLPGGLRARRAVLLPAADVLRRVQRLLGGRRPAGALGTSGRPWRTCRVWARASPQTPASASAWRGASWPTPTQRDLDAVSPEEVAALQQVFLDSDLSARALPWPWSPTPSSSRPR